MWYGISRCWKQLIISTSSLFGHLVSKGTLAKNKVRTLDLFLVPGFDFQRGTLINSLDYQIGKLKL